LISRALQRVRWICYCESPNCLKAAAPQAPDIEIARSAQTRPEWRGQALLDCNRQSSDQELAETVDHGLRAA
jgi:hypothetical protein